MMSNGKPGHFGGKVTDDKWNCYRCWSFDDANKQIKERDHVTYKNGACWTSF